MQAKPMRAVSCHEQQHHLWPCSNHKPPKRENIKLYIELSVALGLLCQHSRFIQRGCAYMECLWVV